MSMITWVFGFLVTGLLTGYWLPWQLGLVAVGLTAWLAALDLVPAAGVLYFAAACAIALGNPPQDVRHPMSVHRDSTDAGERLRLRAARVIDLEFGSDAPTARALLVADQSEIPRDVKREYADAGIVHMLAISGLHVSIVAASLALLFGAARVPLRAASVLNAAIIIGYVFVLGFPAPALRSAVMICVGTAAHACQRHTSRWSILAIGGMVPLLDPQAVLSVGYQLSMLGVAAVIASGSVTARGSLGRLRGWRRGVGHGLVVSTIATLVTAPLVACWFGRLSLIGPLTNLVADPVIALVQPMLFLALVLSPWPEAGRFVASAAHPLLIAFEAIARYAASLPHAAIDVSVSPMAIALSVVAAMALLVACASRLPGRALAVAAGAVCLTVWIA
jgi:competence protein ComEC